MQIGESFSPYKMFVGAFIPTAILANPDLRPSAKLVYGRLCQYAGKDGYAFPKQETLAQECGLAPRSIQAPLDELVKIGLIRVIRPEGKNRLMHKSNRYEFLWHSMFDDSTENCGSECASERSPASASERNPTEENHIEENHDNTCEHPKKPDARIPKFIKWFCDRFQEERGSRYLVRNGKDQKLVMTLLLGLSLDDLQGRASAMFEDKWWHDKASIQTLYSNINKFIAPPTIDYKDGF